MSIANASSWLDSKPVRRLRSLASAFVNCVSKHSSGGSSPHTVYIREEECYVDVTSLENVEWDETSEQYMIETKIPPIEQETVRSNPMVRSKFRVETRSDGLYLTESVDNPESAFFISEIFSELTAA